MTAALITAALAVVAGAVFGLGDGRVMVSPPEAVVEDFMRALERGRLPQARKYLSADGRAAARLDDARARLDARIGEMQDVKGEKGRISGDEAEAAAVIKTRKRGEVRLGVRLHRETGEWRIRHVEGLLP